MPGVFGIAFGSGWSLETIFLVLGHVPLVGAATVITLERFVPARPRRLPVVPPEVRAA
jgi:hypothetical protein